MRASIVQIGNSRGVRIPKSLLEQLRFKTAVEFEILPEGLLLRPARETNEKSAREGWAEQFTAALAHNDETDAQEFADWNQPSLSNFDETEW